MSSLEIIGALFLTYLTVGVAFFYYCKEDIDRLLNEDEEVSDLGSNYAMMVLGIAMLWPYSFLKAGEDLE